MPKKILLTGGAGYIGSHTAVELVEAGYDIVVVDNLSNSSRKAVQRVEQLTHSRIKFYAEDLLNFAAMEKIFAAEKFSAVLHFAGLKSVEESTNKPLDYYHTNITATLNVCRLMQQYAVDHLVFSSSATVYGQHEVMPLDENSPIIDATNPYGRSKLMIEKILEDFCTANAKVAIARLRYFNPGGAHISGDIGENPLGVPGNLLPFVSQVAIGRRKSLTIFGDDYDTPDGTCIRDYIHVVDLAKGHLAALEKLALKPGLVTYNLGTGKGNSVLELIEVFERVNQISLPVTKGPRRAGDIPVCYTDPALALKELNWEANLTIEDICRDAWRWQQQNPNGYS
ncbi:MAG: UDP-glucose 4-epimerase GalE [Pseudomonadales bacterium]|nr:UDP-glucose 4-epimerase GalE [Pseudomonadales bacterium]